MTSSAIVVSARGREILDSRGRPTVEADVLLAGGYMGRASVPSGASVGSHEAFELRDREPSRFRGLGVRTAVANVAELIGPAIAGLDARDQVALDRRLLEVDGTEDRRRLGANAMLAVSLASARAAALATDRPLFRHIAELAGVKQPTIPLPMFNMISGGLHAGGQLDIQDVLLIPTGAKSFAKSLEQAVAVHQALADRLLASGFQPLVADEGGWAPALERNRDAIAWVRDAMTAEQVDGGIALDVAATHFHDHATGDYVLSAEGTTLDAEEMIDVLEAWTDEFGLASIEDGLAEDDWNGWTCLTERLGQRIQILGDDLFATNLERLRFGIARGAGNAVLVKVNQAGTLTEALSVVQAAKAFGYTTVVSARSGETEDSFLADLAVGTAAGQIKIGSVTRSERLAKWNQLLRIEEELGTDHYVGVRGLHP